MLGWTVSPPLRTSLLRSLILVQSLPEPSCSAAIFQRLSPSLTVYQERPLPASALATATAPLGFTGVVASAKTSAALFAAPGFVTEVGGVVFVAVAGFDPAGVGMR